MLGSCFDKLNALLTVLTEYICMYNRKKANPLVYRHVLTAYLPHTYSNLRYTFTSSVLTLYLLKLTLYLQYTYSYLWRTNCKYAVSTSKYTVTTE